MANANPPQPGPQAGPQPDFALLSQSLHQAGTQCAYIANFPPIAQPGAIMHQIQQNHLQTQEQFQQVQQQFKQVQQQIQNTQQQMQDQMQQMQQQMQDQMQQMQQHMQDHMQQMQQQMQDQMQQMQHQMQRMITNGFQVNEHNSIARLHNGSIGRADAPLTALHDFTTNAPVQNFPATPADISTLSTARLDQLLAAFDLPTIGTPAEKKRDLRFHIGLRDVRG